MTNSKVQQDVKTQEKNKAIASPRIEDDSSQLVLPVVDTSAYPNLKKGASKLGVINAPDFAAAVNATAYAAADTDERPILQGINISFVYDITCPKQSRHWLHLHFT